MTNFRNPKVYDVLSPGMLYVGFESGDVVLYNIDSCLSGGSIIGAIRQGDLKLIVRELNQTWWPVPRTNAPADRFYEAFEVGDTTVPVQLYNLSADPTESRDLSAQLPGAVDALNATLQRYADGMSDAVACDQPADNKYLAVWAKRGFVSPWLDDPLYMYACSAAICPPGAPMLGCQRGCTQHGTAL